jgi:hypothetical protein
MHVLEANLIEFRKNNNDNNNNNLISVHFILRRAPTNAAYIEYRHISALYGVGRIKFSYCDRAAN